MNIDLTEDDLDCESRAYRNLWQAVILLAFEEALCGEDELRYPALAWFFDSPFQKNRESVFSYANQSESEWQRRLKNVILHRIKD